MTPREPTSTERRIRTLLLAIIAGILVTTALLTGGPRSGTIAVGSEAPAFSLPNMVDSRESLAEHRGQPVYLLFWATWCQICSVELAEMATLAATPEAQHVVFRAIAMNGPQDIERHRQREGIPWESTIPILLDSQSRVARKYQINAVPTSILIDAEGRVVRSFEGRVGRRTLAGALDTLD
jgi:peroxiredoxin